MILVEDFNIDSVLKEHFSEYLEESVYDFISSDSLNTYMESIFLPSKEQIKVNGFQNALNNDLKKICSKYKLNLNKVNTVIEQTKNDIINQLKNLKVKNMTTNNIFSDIFSKVIQAVKDLFTFSGDSTKVSYSLFLLVGILIVNTISMLIISGINPSLSPLFATVIAPATEEIAKMIAIKYNFQSEFMAIFNIYEFTSYLNMFKKTADVYGVKVKWINAIMLRGLTVVMHYTTGIVQKYFHNNNEDSLKYGTFLGMIIHGIYNALGTVFNNKALEKIFITG